MKVTQSDLNFLHMTLCDLVDQLENDITGNQKDDIIECIRITEHIIAEYSIN